MSLSDTNVSNIGKFYLAIIFSLTAYNLVMFILNIANKFKEYGIPYAVVGSFSVVLHGAIRGAVDIVNILSKEKMIMMEFKSGRKQDLIDVETLRGLDGD